MKRNFTREVEVEAEAHQNGVVVEWAEEFQTLCTLSAYKDNVFHPWEVAFTVFNVSLCACVYVCKALLFIGFSFVGLCDFDYININSWVFTSSKIIGISWVSMVFFFFW